MEEFARTFFEHNGLWALFVLMLLDNIGVPFPSEVPLLLAGFFVSKGDMAFLSAALVGAAGGLAGALILYTLGRSIGRAVVIRWGKVIRISEQDIDRAERWFHRRGELSVFFLRVVPLARTVISIPAGMLEMNAARFSIYTFTGALAWCIAVIGAGVALGQNYERVLGGFGLASIVAASVLGMIALIVGFKWWTSKRPAPVPPNEEPPA